MITNPSKLDSQSKLSRLFWINNYNYPAYECEFEEKGVFSAELRGREVGLKQNLIC